MCRIGYMLQLPKPMCLEPVLHNKRSYHNEKPSHRNEKWTPRIPTRESLDATTKTQQKTREKRSRNNSATLGQGPGGPLKGYT